MRYPGHVEYVRVLKESGFNAKPTLETLSPLDVTSKILFDEWKLGEMEEELTVMRVTLVGISKKTNKKEEIVFDLHDEFDVKTKTSSMARTTGYTATAAVNMFLEGLVKRQIYYQN